MTWVLVGAVALATAAWWQVSMATATEPDTDEPKTPYRDLRTPTLTATAGLLAGTVTAITVHTTTHPTWPWWIVVATAGTVLALVDAATTWMPKRIAHIGWTMTIPAALTSTLLDHTHHTVITATAGGLGTGLLFLGLWLISRKAFGFGDVRFMPLLGAATAATSLRCWTTALLLGTVLLGLHAAIDRIATHRVRVFPWAPAFMAGAIIAMWLT